MSDPDPFSIVQQITSGYILPRCLHVVADLGLADMLDERPRNISDLAVAVNAHPDALARVLRLLAAHGVFELQGETVRHSAASQLLRTDHPQSLNAFVRTFGAQINWAIYEQLAYSVRTGRPAANEVLPEGLWAYRAQNPEAGRLFNASMAARAQGQIAAILAAYDFSGFERVCDIAGGLGHLLRAVLDATPTVKGVLFDLPHVIEEVAALASTRLTLQVGDFFVDALPLCDGYLLMDIIHDWGDDDSVAILTAIRQVAPPQAKLLVIEAIVPDDPGPHWSKILDIHMLTLFGGQQRTRQEYEALLKRSGFLLQREIATRASVAILEAVPV